tara:strand:- start:23 stop:274 length:252 start_codon:yes stop_codon:yes gene_type:complete
MSEIIKLQEEELQQLKETQNQITQFIYNLGQFEVQKTTVLTQLEQVQGKQNEFAKELNKKYGEGNINLETGELTLVKSSESTE